MCNTEYKQCLNCFELFTGTIEDYKLLENMNRITINKYTEMKSTADEIAERLQTLNEKCRHIYTHVLLLKRMERNK